MPRIMVAVERDGVVEVKNIGRPASLVAFGDKFKKSAPTSYDEIAWLAHRTFAPERPFQEWLDELDELTANEEVVAAAQRAQADAMTPAERLDAMTAAELVELGDVDEGRGLAKLLTEARDELAKRKAADDGKAEAIAARVFLETMSDTEREAIPRDELERLQRLAATAPPSGDVSVPTTPPPVTAGVDG